MYLALWQTWGLKMRTSHKIGLSSIYCLVVALMVLDIVRIIESLVYRSWTRSTFFDMLEVVLVVIVAALPGFRFARTGHWLDDVLQRISSLASSSKRSITRRLGTNSSRDNMHSDQEWKYSGNCISDGIQPLHKGQGVLCRIYRSTLLFIGQ